MKIRYIIFQFLLISTHCYAFAMEWSPGSWMQKMFITKKHEAVQSYHQQDYNQSLAEFHELMNHDPYNAEYNYNVGNILYRQKKYSDARQAFARTIEHAQKTSQLAEQAYFNMGNSCYQLEQWRDAVSAYEHVLKINEDNESAHHNLQLALYKLKEQEMKEQQQEQEDTQQKKSQDKNKDSSCDKQEQSQDNQQGSDDADGDDSDQGVTGDKPQDQGQKKPGSQKNGHEQGGGKEKEKNDAGNEQDDDAQDKSSQKDEQGEEDSQDGIDNEQGMGESEQKGSDKSSKNSLQNSGEEKKDGDDPMQQFENTQGVGQEEQSAAPQEQDATVQDKKDAGKGMQSNHKKAELEDPLRDQFESSASGDERLSDYHASVMKTLEDLEEKIQKHIIKNKVAMQGAGQDGKNGW